MYEEPIVPLSRFEQEQQRENTYASGFSTVSYTDSFSSNPSTGGESCSTGYSLSPGPSHFQSFTPSSRGSASARSSVTSSALSRSSYQFGFWKVKFLRPPSVFTVNKDKLSETWDFACHQYRDFVMDTGLSEQSFFRQPSVLIKWHSQEEGGKKEMQQAMAKNILLCESCASDPLSSSCFGWNCASNVNSFCGCRVMPWEYLWLHSEIVCVWPSILQYLSFHNIWVVLIVVSVVEKSDGSSRWVFPHSYMKTFSVPVSKKLYIILFLKYVSVTPMYSGVCSRARPVLSTSVFVYPLNLPQGPQYRTGDSGSDCCDCVALLCECVTRTSCLSFLHWASFPLHVIHRKVLWIIVVQIQFFFLTLLRILM